MCVGFFFQVSVTFQPTPGKKRRPNPMAAKDAQHSARFTALQERKIAIEKKLQSLMMEKYQMETAAKKKELLCVMVNAEGVSLHQDADVVFRVWLKLPFVLYFTLCW